MKCLLKPVTFTLAVSLLALAVAGQTPASTKNLGTSPSTRNSSAANLWGGAQVLWQFSSSGDLADNTLVGARLLYELELGVSKLHLPVMGNISALTAAATAGAADQEQLDQEAAELLASSTGLTVGLYPYYQVLNGSAVSVFVHGVAAWKLNAFPTESGDKQYLSQGRFSVGAEVWLGKIKGGRLPLTLSITPVLTVMSSATYQEIFGEAKSMLPSLEITGVVPLGQGVGLMAEGVVAGNGHSSIRGGLILAVGISK